MGHVPHLVVGAPWPEEELRLSVLQSRHLTKVLKRTRGDPVTYTDGLGMIGEGVLTDHGVRRGEERGVSRPLELTVAVAPPSNKDRQRFLVEKLAELGVARLQWLQTSHGARRMPSPNKVFGWAVAALEQSRGAFLMETGPELARWPDLAEPVLVCHPGGASRPAIRPRTVVIGPEGGFGEDEIPPDLPTWDLGPTVLRVETAAMVAAARLLG